MGKVLETPSLNAECLQSVEGKREVLSCGVEKVRQFKGKIGKASSPQAENTRNL